MRAFRAAGAALAAIALGTAAPALAQSAPSPAPAGATGNAAAAELTSRVDAAIANATSYHVTVRGPNLSVDIHEFGPDRVRIATTNSGKSFESIVVGTAMYYRAPGADWKAYPVPPVARVRRNRLYMGAPDTLLEPLADRTADGETLGAFRSQAVANNQLPGTMECTYDKATYRPRTCTVTVQNLAAPIQVAYAGWDDPANVVEPPPGVAPPPAPSPRPSPTPGGTR